MIYFPAPWIHRINPVPRFPPPVFPPWSAFPPTRRASCLPGWEGTPRPRYHEQRAPGPQNPALGQEADEVAGSGLGKCKDREMG